MRRDNAAAVPALERSLGLAYVALAQGRTDDANALLDEGGALAEASEAWHIVQQVSEARAALSR